MFKPMVVSGLTVDPLTNSPIVILKETDGERTLPIWIGLLEATAIASELEGIKFSRPMTHDLLKSIMDTMDVEVNKVEVCDLKNNTYYALIHMTHGDKEISIDARPSDALALSLRMKAPIFVSEEVISKSKQIDLTAEAEDTSEQGKKWQDILEKLNPEDFGKYKM
jgi:bifunctional DNase/RNase